jgi:UPF0755 protein
MIRRRNHGCLLGIFVAVFAILGLAIIWIAVPILAASAFGSPASYLTGFTRWNYSLQVLIGRNDLITPASTVPAEVDFEIQSGESVNSVATRLAAAGLISDASDFRAYLIYSGLDSRIKAGKFKISPSMTAIEIASAIQSTYSPIVSFYIYPGWRAEEIAAALPTSGIEVSPEDFLRLVHNPSLISTPNIASGFPTADGFLFPGEYEIDRKITPEGLALTFLNRFQTNVDAEISDAFEKNGLTLYEGITLASIIQRETFEDQERPKIASVFYNRLANNAKLETDPTVQYALGYSDVWGGWWKTPLSAEDLQVNSPYNTYQVFGLPPTPISNPDLSSIQAAAFPEETPYFYFRAKCDGSGFHDFSVTFEEHVSKACK